MNVAERNNVAARGSGPVTFLFSHGFGCDQSMWRHVAPAFIETSKVVLFDHVGSGRSQVDAYDIRKYASLQGYANDLIEICDEGGLADVVFVGHSVSATIGVLAAIARPELFSKLILICPTPRYANTENYVGGFGEADIDELLDLMDKNHLDWSALMSPVVIGAGHPHEFETEWRDSVCRVDPTIAKDFARVTFKSDHRADYRTVSTPCLLIECSEDALAPPQVGEYLHREMPGSQRFILQATGHCPHMTSPDEVVAAIRDFVVAPTKAAANP